jgi:hypothetical protein
VKIVPAGGTAKVVEYLPSKYKALNSNLRTIKKKKKQNNEKHQQKLSWWYGLSGRAPAYQA